MSKQNKFLLNYIGKRLGDKRKEKKMTVTKIADMMCVKHPYVINIFNGNIEASIEKLKEYAYVLGVSDKDFKQIELEGRTLDLEDFKSRNGLGTPKNILTIGNDLEIQNNKGKATGLFVKIVGIGKCILK